MIDFRVTPAGGESFEITATSQDILTWERSNRNGKVFADLMSKLSMVDCYKVAWIACRRLGHITGEVTLQAFETDYRLDMEKEDEEGGSDPTQRDPSDGSWSDSP
jgi:hypothetical protein